MRAFLYIVSGLVVAALAWWAYLENYRTQAALDEVAQLQDDIGRMREELGMLRAEWAYLNRPDRLRELVEMNFGRLGLVPLAATQFARADEVPFPQTAPLPGLEGLDGTVEVMAREGQAAGGQGGQ